MNRYGSAALLLVAALSACSGYDKNAVQTITSPGAGAFVRFANFGVNAPGVNFFANEVKVTATGSTSCTPPTDPACTTTGLESTSGVAYGGYGTSATTANYESLAPGSYTFSSRIAATVDKNLPVSSVQTTITDGKYYTYYVSGFYDGTAKKADAFVVEDPLPAFDYTQAYVRFVNAIGNSSPMTLYAKNQTAGSAEVAIGGSVAYKTAGAFTALPTGVYDLNTRTAGSSVNAISRTGVTFSAGRVYTITGRGDMTVVSTTATNRPFLDNTNNR